MLVTLDGGGLAVTDGGAAHNLGSTPDALDHLMQNLGLSGVGTTTPDPRP